MKTYNIQTHSVDKAYDIIYQMLSKEYTHKESFKIVLRTIEVTVNCITPFNYVIDVYPSTDNILSALRVKGKV